MSHCTDNQAPAATTRWLDRVTTMMIMTLVTTAIVSQFNYNCRCTERSTVLPDWLECSLVANLENFVVSC